MKMDASKEERGFTLIELMIVVGIIGILAALAMPKFSSLLEKSREAATKGNLSALQGAISTYYGDNDGVNPTWIWCTSDYTFSRYLDTIPPVKATHTGVGATGTTESPSGTAVWHFTNITDDSFSGAGYGWRYNSYTGKVFINSTATDSKELSYSTYGY